MGKGKRVDVYLEVRKRRGHLSTVTSIMTAFSLTFNEMVYHLGLLRDILYRGFGRQER